MTKIVPGIAAGMAILSLRTGLVYFARSQHHGHGAYSAGQVAGAVVLALFFLLGIRAFMRG